MQSILGKGKDMKNNDDAHPRQRLRAEDRKEQIVQTVLRLVGEHGVDSVSTQLIADTIGHSQGIVFRHFPTKETLWMSAIEWLQERLEEVWANARDNPKRNAPLDVLNQIFLGHIKLIAKYPGLAKLVLSDHIHLQFPRLHERFREFHKRYDSQVNGLLIDAVRQGMLPPATNIAAASTMYFCAIQGLGFQFAIARSLDNLTNAAAEVFALYLNGLRAASSDTPHPVDQEQTVKHTRSAPAPGTKAARQSKKNNPNEVN